MAAIATDHSGIPLFQSTQAFVRRARQSFMGNEVIRQNVSLRLATTLTSQSP